MRDRHVARATDMSHASALVETGDVLSNDSGRIEELTGGGAISSLLVTETSRGVVMKVFVAGASGALAESWSPSWLPPATRLWP